VKRAGFNELRNAFLRFGGPQTYRFLQLDKEIENFAAQFTTHSNPVNRLPTFIGMPAGIPEELDRIEQQANQLRQHAVCGMKFCRDELGKKLDIVASFEPERSASKLGVYQSRIRRFTEHPVKSPLNARCDGHDEKWAGTVYPRLLRSQACASIFALSVMLLDRRAHKI
jgi:hypothetical protein